MVPELDRESFVLQHAHGMGNDDSLSLRQAYDQIMNVGSIEPTLQKEQIDQIRVSNVSLKVNRNAVEFMQNVDAIQILWQSTTMKRIWAYRHKAEGLHDAHKHYFDSINRISAYDYLPTDQDILNSRMKTTDPVAQNFNIHGTPFEVIDVGGHQEERYKWVRKEHEPDAVIFVAALSDYDQQLSERRSVNRMEESLNLYKTCCAMFHDKPTLLFLNKKDVFEEKIQYSDIKSFFEDYRGSTNENDKDRGISFFMHKFKRKYEEAVREKHGVGEMVAEADFHHHVTCAIDTADIKVVMDDKNTEAILNHARKGIFKANFHDSLNNL